MADQALEVTTTPTGPASKQLNKRTVIAVTGLLIAAVASLLLVAWPLWMTGRPLADWPPAPLALILFLFTLPLTLASVWWPRRHAVEQAFARRPDSEHEQATIRMVLGGVAMLYLSLASLHLNDDKGLQQAATAMAWGLCVGWLALLHIVVSPAQSTARRAAMAMVDLLTLSYMLAVGGGPASVLFPIYLWVTFGNGFRYGVAFLVFSAGISAIGFGGAILTSSYWSENSFVAYGLLISLIVLPAYVSTLIKKLNRARALAEEASQAKSRFLATMSHELRTPLTAVIATGDLLETTPLNADQRSMVGTVQTSAKALLSLINEILDLSRIEAGKQNLDLDDVDVSEVVSSVWRMLHTQADQKGLQLRVSLDARLPSSLRGDKKRLMQILVNLVGNAIKFTAEGEVEISARLLEQRAGHDLVSLSVRDTGIGVPAEKLGSIFEGFTQADDAINRRYGGTGLGLTITRQLVEMMGGDIEVHSEEGRGSRFDLTIPFELPNSVAEERDVAPEEDSVSPVAHQFPLVLCVSGAQRQALQPVLDAAVTQAAEDFEEAVDAIEAYREQGHVVIAVDAREPIVERLTAYLRARGRTEGIAVIDVSAREGQSRAPRAWPLDVVITSPPEAGGFASALRQSGLFYSSGLSAGELESGAAEEVPAEPVPSRRILLVDDNRTNRRVISRVLENAGHRVETAEDGDQALDRLDIEPFDIVLTDINMPGTSGLDLTKMYRVLHVDEPHLPIVALTADATEQAKEDCREAGMDGFLTKPVEAQQLLAMVRELTAGREDLDEPGDVSTAEQIDEAAGGDGVSDEFAGGAPRKAPVQLITPISAHPKYGGASSEPVLDPDSVEALRALDPDHAFMAEVFDDFLADAEVTMANLNDAFDNGDLAAFHDEAHALRSSAGYVGAKRMVRLLLDLREFGPDRDNKRTRELLAELNNEFEMVRTAVGQEVSQDQRATPL